jgi:hypothetical protein|tara:strand:- start:251 stop:511 length:261 start_codon:yes stop_codon:yes gene_type:complete
MRQGGMKPKGHNSGTYWVRANAKNGKDASSKKKKQVGVDTNGDGEFDTFIDEDIYNQPLFKLWLDVIWRLGLIGAGIGVIIALIIA